MIATEQRFAVADLLADAVNLLDHDRLEEWVECFADDAAYRVLSRENTERKLPLPLFQCDNKAMMRDRVLSLRKANVFNPHRDRHVVGLPRLTPGTQGEILAESSYALYQINHDGVGRLFSLGVYLDRIRVTPQGPRFAERRVIVDMFGVPTMLSTPI